MSKAKGSKSKVVIAAVAVVLLTTVGYFVFSGGILGGSTSGFGIDINTGSKAIDAAAKAAAPDTNAFDETNPYGYKNPFR